MDWANDASAIAAIYAAIVATAALALEVRRWFESGPRLSLTLMPEAEVYDADIPDPNTYLLARVTNRGTMPTTITHYCLLEYRSLFHRLVGKDNRTAWVRQPFGGHPLPYLLQSGTEWSGSAIYDEELREWAISGKLFVAIYHSHARRPLQAKVKLAPKEEAAPET